MKLTIQGFVVVGALVLGGSALAENKSDTKGTADVRGFVVPTDEKAFLERLHYTNQQEIKLGKLAQQNSTNPDVKSFGEMMVRDHTDADQKLVSMAQGRGMKLSDMPKPMNDVEKKAMAADKANMEKLQVLKGEPFDSCYMSNMVGDHDDTLGKLMAGRQALSGNAQLTGMLDTLTPTIAQHRERAYSILGKLGQSMMGVGGAGTQKGTESGMGGHMGTGTGGTQGGTQGGSMGTGMGGTQGGSTGTGSGTKK